MSFDIDDLTFLDSDDDLGFADWVALDGDDSDDSDDYSDELIADFFEECFDLDDDSDDSLEGLLNE